MKSIRKRKRRWTEIRGIKYNENKTEALWIPRKRRNREPRIRMWEKGVKIE